MRYVSLGTSGLRPRCTSRWGSGVALAWLLDRPAVAGPIVGATKPHHLGEAIAALDVALN